MCKTKARCVSSFAFLFLFTYLAAAPCAGQMYGTVATPPAASGAQVIQVHHHHYYNLGSPATSMASHYSPQFAWHYGYQTQTGNYVAPWKQNWGHLGFTGYMGQHGGGVEVTAETFVGLVVDTVTPGSPAAKMGLVPGDFILSINNVKVDGYKQAGVLFEETAKNKKEPLVLQVWNPHTRRTSNLRATLVND